MTWTWTWWLHSDGGLLARIAIGASIFAVLAAVDLARHGRRATRWREYLFLVLAAALALAYGAANDRIASAISWEYFYYGKGLERAVGPRTPPDPAALRRQAVRLGLKATWTAGLIAGVALLLANNPRPNRPRLRYRTLSECLLAIFLCTAACAVVGAVAGARGWLAWTNPDLRALLRQDLFRPRRFLAVYGMNLGGYAGGILATFASVAWVLRRRAASASPVRMRQAKKGVYHREH